MQQTFNAYNCFHILYFLSCNYLFSFYQHTKKNVLKLRLLFNLLQKAPVHRINLQERPGWCGQPPALYSSPSSGGCEGWAPRLAPSNGSSTCEVKHFFHRLDPPYKNVDTDGLLFRFPVFILKRFYIVVLVDVNIFLSG